MESSHTPGPWIAEGKTVKAISHGKRFKVARIDGRQITEQGNEANARLVAAAPELLAALRNLLSLLNEDKDGDYFICQEGAEYIHAAQELAQELMAKHT